MKSEKFLELSSETKHNLKKIRLRFDLSKRIIPQNFFQGLINLRIIELSKTV